MSKAVLLSIQPKWCERIASRIKKLELRKTKPKLNTPFKCYIYCTLSGANEAFKSWGNDLAKWNRENWGIRKANIIGEFICDCIYEIDEPYLTWLEEQSCVDMNDIAIYKGEKDLIYALQITELKVYDKPKSLSEFNLKRPPLSWCYVEERKGEGK